MGDIFEGQRHCSSYLEDRVGPDGTRSDWARPGRTGPESKTSITRVFDQSRHISLGQRDSAAGLMVC